jgi:broad specificity phosphatase PhoE
VLVRHGETEWSLAGRHTGRTDVPLTAHGREEAGLVGAALRKWRFARVFTSPLARALDTCRLAGLGDAAEERDDLAEWDYGAYEGLTTDEIRLERPGWTLWDDGVIGGETVEDVGTRADRVIAELRAIDGDAAVFAHGHVLRVFGARWVSLPPTAGALLALEPATVSILGYERERAVIWSWNTNVGAAGRLGAAIRQYPTAPRRSQGKTPGSCGNG